MLALVASVLALPALGRAQAGIGGARSNGLVRAQVSAGYVPLPEAFTVEGMLSEHHFPVRPERCERYFCVLTAMGHGVDRATGTGSAYLLIEPVDGIDPRTFRRAPLNAAIVIDRSGSMTGWKFSAALAAAHAVIDQLDPRDRLAVIAFDDEPTLVVPSTPVTNRAALHRAVSGIAIGGSTNIHDGLAMGFEQVARAAGQAGVADRVFVLTDEQPNVGVTGTGSFQELIGTFARRHIGLSVIGVGLDLGAELANAMAQLEGGSSHFIENAEGLAQMFGPGFATMVTPVATQLTVEVTPPDGMRVAEVYGVPSENVYRDGTPGGRGRVALRASTVFYDPRRSGIVVRLEPAGAARAGAIVAQASARVAYAFRRSDTGAMETGATLVTHVATRPDAVAEFATPDQYRAYALVNFARQLRASLEMWRDGRHAMAVRTLAAARRDIDADARGMRDPELARERTLADGLLVQMGEGARAQVAAEGVVAR